MKKSIKTIIFLSLILGLFLISSCTENTTVVNDSTLEDMVDVNQVSSDNSQATSQTGDNEVVMESSSFTLTQIADHSTVDDCWMAINGKVYDVSLYVSRHPGGKAIVQGCGLDSTELFETRPMGSGTPHSSNARNLMDDYYIGELSN